MPESFVQVTEGSGKKLHTFQRTVGANIVEDEVVLVGESYLPGYLVGNSVAISTVTTNSHLLQLMAGASLPVRVRRIEMYQEALAGGTAIAKAELRRLTSAGTGGTVLTPEKLDPADAASGATARALPGTPGTEGSVVAFWSGVLPTTAPTTVALVGGPMLVWDFERLRSKGLIIPAGTANGIAIKWLVGIVSASVRFNVWFDEINF